VRFLLRPGWLALIVVAVGFAVACYTLLAPWQFGREAQRDAQQQAIDDSFRTPPVPLQQLSPPGAGVRAEVEWRQVSVSGSYLPESEALVRLRVYEGQPAFEVLTPVRTDDGRLLLVDRGFVKVDRGVEVPAFAAAPAGPVTLVGRLRVDDADPQDRPAFEGEGRRQVYAADSRPVAAATGLALEPGRLQLAADQPGVLGPVPVAPNTGAAPFTNFSYALQWLTFGAIALFATAYFVRLELLQRRAGGGRAAERSALRRALAGDDPDPAGPRAGAPPT
jgi:cytochrome oxidase assembly protein ShyY1